MTSLTRPLTTLCLLLSLATLSSACATAPLATCPRAHVSPSHAALPLAHDDNAHDNTKAPLVTPHELNQVPLIWR